MPSGYWKIVAVPEGESARVAAFIFDQANPPDLCQQLTKVDEVEARSGLEFFHGLSAAAQAQLEAGEATLKSDRDAKGFGCDN